MEVREVRHLVATGKEIKRTTRVLELQLQDKMLASFTLLRILNVM